MHFPQQQFLSSGYFITRNSIKSRRKTRPRYGLESLNKIHAYFLLDFTIMNILMVISARLNISVIVK